MRILSDVLRDNAWEQQDRAWAQVLLGLCYAQAIGVTKDAKRAAELFSQGAALGNVDALYHMAKCLANGRGVVKELSRPARLFEQSAAQGHPDAQRELGSCYEKGLGVASDLWRAPRHATRCDAI